MRKKKQTYEKLRNEGIKQGHDKFCAVIALSVMADIGFNRAAKLMEPSRKNKKSGSCPDIYMPIYQKTLSLRNKKLSYVLGSFDRISRQFATKKFARYTTKKFAQKFDKGTYLLHTARHTLVIRDGMIEDWNKELPRGQVVQEAYKVINL